MDHKNIRNSLKNFPWLYSLLRNLYRAFDLNRSGGRTYLDVVKTFPLYRPCGAGRYKARAQLTIQSINQTLPFLSELVKFLNGGLIAVTDIVDFPKNDKDLISALELKKYFDSYGSDKSTGHNFHFLYGSILSSKDKIKNIFEIGLGTNNKDVVSNMGAKGSPGASLRAFRDYCPNAAIFGADIDKRILFQEDRIATYFLDQTDPSTFVDIAPKLPKEFDLVIDDGLHSPNTNIESLKFGLQIIKKDGWVVIEDIAYESIPLWQVISALLGSKYSCSILTADGAIVFAVKRLV